MTKHTKQTLSLLFIFLALFNALGCGTSQGLRATSPRSQTSVAGSVVAVEPSLLGIPDAAASDASESVEDGPLFVPNSQNGELIIPLRQGAPAPVMGVLFNGPAVARVSVEFRAQRTRCEIERRRDVELVVARYNADVASMNLALQTQQRTDQVLITARDQDLARLNRLLETQTSASSGPHVTEGLIWAGGGLLLGVLIVGGVVVFANARP